MQNNHGGEAERGLVLLIGGAPGGRRRQPVRPEAALGLLATLPPETLLGRPIPASVLQLADPADPQLLLAHLQTAARTPGPVLVALVGQLTADRRRRELHLALARTTRDNTRYSALPWAWLGDQLRQRPPGTTTVLVDLVADPEAWSVLGQYGPEALTAGLPLVGQVSPPGTIGDGYAPAYTRALVDHLRRAAPGTRPLDLHHLAAHSGLPTGALLLTTDPPPPPPAPAPAAFPPASAPAWVPPALAAGAVPLAPSPASPPTPARDAVPPALAPGSVPPGPTAMGTRPSGTVPAPAVPTTAAAAPGGGVAATAPAGPDRGVEARPVPGQAGPAVSEVPVAPAPALAPAAPPISPAVRALLPTPVATPAQPGRAEERDEATAAGAAGAVPGAEALPDPRAGIAAALHGRDLPRAAYLIADWERHLLRHQGPRAPQLADVAEAQAQLALAAGDLEQATERLIEAARLGMPHLPPDAAALTTAVDNAVAIWGRLPRDAALRHSAALLTLCRALPAGANRLRDVEARLAQLTERTGLLRRAR